MLDVEDWAALIGAAVAGVVLAVESHGGEVVQLAGDGVIARFPAGGDAALQALRAALSAVTTIVDQAGDDRGRVALRVGVEAGAAEEDALFDLATAFETAAPANGVLAGPTIHRLLEHRVSWARGDDVRAPSGSLLPSWRPRLDVRYAVPGTASTVSARQRPDVREERKIIGALFVHASRDGAPDEGAAAEVQKIVERYEGSARMLAGGVTVAFFGVPAHEDDAERAVRAGLEAVHRFPRARAGASVGPAALVLHGAGHHVEFTALGDVMNTAARLMAAAGDGELLVHAPLYDRVAHAFAVEERRTLMVKGKAQSVEAVLVGPERVRSPSTGGGALLIGRHREIADLESWVATLVACRSGIVVVEGEAGVGKSSLIGQACRSATARGVEVMTASTRSHAQTLPYWPLRHLAGALLEDHAVGDDGSPRALPLVADRGAADEGAAVDAVEVRHQRIVHALVDGLRQRAADHPLLLVVEDLHWSDRWTLAALEAVDDVVGVLVTRRPVGDHPSQALVDRAAGAGTLLQLEPLTAGEDRTLLDALVGRSVLPPAVEDRVLELAGGNPLFLGELCRHLVDRAVVVPDENRWRFDGLDQIDLPDTVQRVVLARADRLPASVRAVLNAASVVSRGLDARILRHIVGDDETTDAALAELARVALLEHHGDEVSFSHAVVADAVASTVLRRDRRRIHARAAQAFAELRADSPNLWGTLAWHAAEGGDPALALRYAEPAAEHAHAGLAFEQAALHYELALRAHAELGCAPADRLRLLLAIGRERHAAGLMTDALDAYVDAAELATELDDRHGLALAALGHEAVYFATRRPRTDRSGALLRRALAATDLDTDRARLLAALATDSAFSDRQEESKRLGDEAVALARSLDDEVILAEALHAWRMTRGAPAEAAERLLATREMERVATRAGDGALALEAGRLRLLDELALGRMSEAAKTIERVEVLADELGQPRYLWYPAMWRGMWLLHRGRLEHAEEHIEVFREEGRRRRYADTETVYALQLFLLRREQGRCRDVAPFISSLHRRGDPVVPHRFTPMLSVLRADLGDHAGAAAILDDCLDQDFGQIPRDQSAGLAVALLADSAASIGHRTAAEFLYERARDWDGQHIVVGSGAACIGAGAHVRGALAGLLGRLADASDHLQAAHAANEAADSPLLAGHSAIDAAAVAHRTGDEDQARRYLSLARRHSARTSSVRLARRVADAGRILSGAAPGIHPPVK